MKISLYSHNYQPQVKNLVISVHEEFGFPYDEKLDYDLEDPAKFYNKSGGIFYILLDHNKVVGTVAIKKISKDSAELKRMYLLPEYRGRGWGTKLLEKAITFSKKVGFKELNLDTNAKQIDAQKLYKKSGFKIDRTEKKTIHMVLDVTIHHAH